MWGGTTQDYLDWIDFGADRLVTLIKVSVLVVWAMESKLRLLLRGGDLCEFVFTFQYFEILIKCKVLLVESPRG